MVLAGQLGFALHLRYSMLEIKWDADERLRVCVYICKFVRYEVGRPGTE